MDRLQKNTPRTNTPFQSKSWNSYLYPSLGQFCTLYSKVLGCQSCVNNRFSFSPFLTSPLTLFYGNFRQVSRHHTFPSHLTTVNWLKKAWNKKHCSSFTMCCSFFIVSPKSCTEKPWGFHTENLGKWVWAMLYVNAEHVISCLSYLILWTPTVLYYVRVIFFPSSLVKPFPLGKGR